jgi:hypothetical protein
MASTLKQLFDTSALVTITLASLGSGSWRQSASVDNSTKLYLDAKLIMKVKTGATAAGTVDIWLYASADGGTTFSDGASGSDATFTPTATPNLTFVTSIQTPTATTTYTSAVNSLAAVFGGDLPQQWGLAIKNTNGGALDSTEGNFLKSYQGIWFQSV